MCQLASGDRIIRCRECGQVLESTVSDGDYYTLILEALEIGSVDVQHDAVAALGNLAATDGKYDGDDLTSLVNMSGVIPHLIKMLRRSDSVGQILAARTLGNLPGSKKIKLDATFEAIR